MVFAKFRADFFPLDNEFKIYEISKFKIRIFAKCWPGFQRESPNFADLQRTLNCLRKWGASAGESLGLGKVRNLNFWGGGQLYGREKGENLHFCKGQKTETFVENGEDTARLLIAPNFGGDDNFLSIKAI